MGEISSGTKVHVVRAAPWKDAIIKLLEPSSPYRPWGEELQAKPGDAILAILDTDPLAVIAEILPFTADGGPDCVLAGFADTERNRRPALLELATFTALTGLSPIECDGETTKHRHQRTGNERRQCDAFFTDIGDSKADQRRCDEQCRRPDEIGHTIRDEKHRKRSKVENEALLAGKGFCAHVAD